MTNSIEYAMASYPWITCFALASISMLMFMAGVCIAEIVCKKRGGL